MTATNPIARYYDRNTGRFLWVGGSGGAYAIHRALWGPGVTTSEEASNYINVLIAECIEEVAAPIGSIEILDLGCGVGGTLFQLCARFPESRGLGVTISRKQLEIARRLSGRRGLSDRCRFIQGDFQRMDLDIRADVGVAVESFVHSLSPSVFLDSAARHVQSGGIMIVVDDFLAVAAQELPEIDRRHVRTFQEGWRLPGLCTVEELEEESERAGFEVVEIRDLSSLVRLGRPRDMLIAWTAPLFRRLGLDGIPFFGNMIGGNALQVGLRKGFIRYRAVVLRRRG